MSRDLKTLIYRTEKRVAHITLNRPEKMNTFNQEVYDDMAHALRCAQSDDDVSVILLSAKGDDYSAGNDIGDFLELGTNPDALETAKAYSANIVNALNEVDKPLIAAVRGRAIGFGATQLLLCDVVIASETASLKFPFVDLGLVPEACSSVLLPRLVGQSVALQLFFEADFISAQRARDINLVAQVVADQDLEQVALDYASKLARKSVTALRATKRLVRFPENSLQQQASKEFENFGIRLESKEAKAIFSAFLGKATPSPAA
jgi:enoyl-CoA hydratase/carnithine racemase